MFRFVGPLMWKSWCIRKRHYIYTAAELLLPVAFFCLLVYLKVNADNQSHDHGLQPKSIFNPISKDELCSQGNILSRDNMVIVYTPDNNSTVNDLISEVIYKLKIKNINVSTKSVSNENEMSKYMNDKYGNSTYLNLMVYGVVFHTSKPNFEYTLRPISQSIQTTSIFPIFSMPGPGNQHYPYLSEGFVMLQILVNDAIYKLISPNGTSEINFKINEFPYPAYEVDANFREFFTMIIPLLVMFGYYVITPNLISNAIQEKNSGSREWMGMVGIPRIMILFSWVLHSMAIYLITTLINSFILTGISVGGSPLLSSTNFFVIWLVLFLYCTCTIFFLLAFTAFINNPNVGVTVAALLCILPSVIVSNYQKAHDLSYIAKILTSIFPSVSLNWAFTAISSFEASNEYMSFSSLFTVQKAQNTNVPLGISLVILFLTTILYSLIYIYIDSIKPGQYGRARPWYFPIQAIFSFCYSKRSDTQIPESNKSRSTFEDVPNLSVGLSFQGIQKNFGNVNAIEDVTIDIYKGQITALLGHNGAGKTTLINIVTGMFSPTKGKVWKDNKNVFDDFPSFQKNLGLCPQHDLLFPYLNVIEHVMFFGMLRGLSRKNAIKESKELLEFFGISNKANSLTKKLSGGMKRKLSLAISLVGNPEILILDEPTSGMDPESRRDTWNKLLALRGERTIILTTHYMEEADVLGDMIAIMDHGIIKCYGTSLYLKRQFGSGYKITLPSQYQGDIEKTIKRFIPDASASSVTDTTVSYSFSLEKSYLFSEMFSAIESVLPESSGMSVSCTTLDDVFLKVAHNNLDEVDMMNSDEELLLSDSYKGDELHSSSEALTPKALTGFALFQRRLVALFMKKMLYNYHRWASWLFQTVLYPFIILLIPLLLTSTILNSEFNDPSLPMELNIYSDTQVLISNGTNNKLVNSLNKLVQKEGSEAIFIKEEMNQALLNASTENLSKYRFYYIVAFDLSQQIANLFFSSIGTHSIPIAINLFYNAMFSINGSTSTLTTLNHPFNFKENICSQPLVFSTIPPFIWIFTVPTVLAVICYSMSRLHHDERLNSGKLLQLMTGTSPVLYWFSAFICDFILFSASSLLIVLYVYIFDTAGLFSSSRDYGLLLMVLIMSCIGLTWFGYLMSYFLRTFSRLFSMNIFLTLIFGQVAYFIVLILKLTSGTQNESPDKYTDSQMSTIQGIDITHHILMFYPSYCCTALIYKVIKYLSLNLILEKCAGQSEDNLFSWKNDGINQELVYISVDWVIFAIIICMIDYGVFAKTLNFIFQKIYGSIDVSTENPDDDVDRERSKVEEALNHNQGLGTNVVVDSLGKKYSKSVTAVKNISFIVPKGECFGLLGVNGAGKSTTFKMLTGDLLPSSGQAFIFGDSLRGDTLKYQSHIGYCPQTDAIIDALTGQELLTLYASLRGVNPSIMNRTISFWINEFGLQGVCNRRSETYSGGNKRKLSTAISLIGDPQVVFLDEPTTGVDPVARRKFWSILSKLQKKGCTIILTSHSMDECETVCDRLTIMVQGEMKCVGNIQRLKDLYGQGFTILMQLKEHSTQQVENLKSSFSQMFSPHAILRDEHIGLLHYHINSPKYRWSKLFAIMEDIKQNNPFVSEYVITETTLEQIFLHFAKM